VAVSGYANEPVSNTISRTSRNERVTVPATAELARTYMTFAAPRRSRTSRLSSGSWRHDYRFKLFGALGAKVLTFGEGYAAKR